MKNNNLMAANIGIAIAGIGFGLVNPVTVVLLEQNKTPSFITGLVTMMGYLTIVLFSGITGKLFEKYSLKKLLLFGLALWSISSLGHFFWYKLYILFPLKITMGIGGTFVFIGTEILINRTSDSSNRGKNIGLYATFLSVGIAIGTLLIWTISIRPYVPFIIGSSIMCVAVLYLSFFLSDVEKPDNHNPVKSYPIKNMPMLGLFTPLLYGIFESSTIVVIPIYGLRIGFSQIQVSYLLASFVIGGIILLYGISGFSDRYNKYKLILILSLLLAVLLTVPTFSHGYFVLIGLFFVLGGIIPAFYTIGLNYMIESVDKKYISFANSYYIMMYGIGTVIGPLWGTSLIELSLLNGYWILSAILCLMFFIVFYYVRKQYQNN